MGPKNLYSLFLICGAHRSKYLNMFVYQHILKIYNYRKIYNKNIEKEKKNGKK